MSKILSVVACLILFSFSQAWSGQSIDINGKWLYNSKYILIIRGYENSFTAEWEDKSLAPNIVFGHISASGSVPVFNMTQIISPQARENTVTIFSGHIKGNAIEGMYYDSNGGKNTFSLVRR